MPAGFDVSDIPGSILRNVTGNIRTPRCLIVAFIIHLSYAKRQPDFSFSFSFFDREVGR